MSPVYLNPQHSSSIPFIELKGDHQHNLPIIMGFVHDHVTSSNTNNTYFSRSNFENDNISNYNEYAVADYSTRTQERVVDQKLILSHDKPIVYPFNNNHGDNNHNNNMNNKIIKIDQKPKKCKQIKERIMQKSTTTVKSKRMMIGDQNLNDHGNYNYNVHAQVKQSNIYYHKSSNEVNNNNFIRMCTDCHTTTTPLWRSGPQGPKSLCNACGIRQRKARRAAAAAMAAMDAPLTSPISATTTTTTSTTTTLTTTKSPKLTLEEVKSPQSLDHETIMTHTLPLKKRSKTFSDHTSWNCNNNTNSNNINDNNDNINDYINKPSYYSSQRVFSKDEEEGALLLMALSCGLACSS